MNAKHGKDGQPNVIYLQDVPSMPGSAHPRPGSSCRSPIPMSCTTVRSVPSRWSTCPTRGPAACRTLKPRCRESNRYRPAPKRRALRTAADRIGDLVVVSQRDTVIGTSRARHDLSGLDRAAALARRHLRTAVPLICNRSVEAPANRTPLAQFRRLRSRAQPRRPARKDMSRCPSAANPHAAARFGEALRIAGRRYPRPHHRGHHPYTGELAAPCRRPRLERCSPRSTARTLQADADALRAATRS
jgi:hypothetical protein